MDTNEILAQAVKSRSVELAEQAMKERGMVTCGIERITCGEIELSYVNLGDTYDQTICQEQDGYPFIGSWGGWYEATEQEQNEENETITCGYCSHRTPMNQDDWRDVVCESCENHVGG